MAQPQSEATVSPFERLPNELVSYIFKSGSSTISTNPNSPTCTSPAFQLALVCRRWRALVLSTPTLWTDIELDTTSLLPRSTRLEMIMYSRDPAHKALEREMVKKLKRFVKLCVQRAGSLPLSLSICEELENREHILQILQLSKTADRWESLTVFPHTLVNLVFGSRKYHPVDFPRLKNLSVRHSTLDSIFNHNVYRHTMQLQVFPVFKHLTHFDMQISLVGPDNGGLDRLSPKLLPLPFLTDLDVCGLMFDSNHRMARALLQALRQTAIPRLTHLRITIPPPYPGRAHAEAYEDVNLPYVTHLAISGPSQHLWRHLCFLKLPSLAHLRIHEVASDGDDAHDTNPPTASFEEFVSSCHKLKTLEIQGLPYERCATLIQATQPETLSLAHAYSGSAARRIVCRSIEGIIRSASEKFRRTKKYSIYDSSRNGAILAADIVDMLCSFDDDSRAHLDKDPTKGSKVSINVYSGSPIARDTLAAFHAVRARLPVDIRLHHDSEKRIEDCTLPRSEWFGCFAGRELACGYDSDETSD